MKLIWMRTIAVCLRAAPIIGEAFTVMAVLSEILQQSPDHVRRFLERHHFTIEACQAVASNRSAHIHRVFAWCAADESDVSIVRPSAAIGTPGHSDEQRLLFEPELTKTAVHFVHQP